MNAPSHVDNRIESPPRPLPFVGFVAILAASGPFLYAISGPPHFPTRIPSGSEIVVTLQGSYVPLEWFAYALTTAAWILWIWIVGSLVLRLVTSLAELVTRGAAWAKSLRAATDRFTLPIDRRVVDGAVVAVVVVNLVTRAPTASAAPLNSPAALVAEAPHRRPDPAVDRPVRSTPASSQDTNYTVKSGDTLWSISELFYGTGDEFPRLVDANTGRRVPDGNVFTRTGIIKPGGVLRVPLPSRATQFEGGQTYYVVRKGDTLRGIDDAAILLARQATKATSFLVEIDPRDENDLAEHADEQGTRLGGQVRETITPDRDLVLKLSALKLATLAVPVTDDALDRPLLVPVGVLTGGETLYLPWGELGHVLIAAQPGGGGDAIPTTILAGLAARRRRAGSGTRHHRWGVASVFRQGSGRGGRKARTSTENDERNEVEGPVEDEATPVDAGSPIAGTRSRSGAWADSL